jgi:hypothetical protein
MVHVLAVDGVIIVHARAAAPLCNVAIGVEMMILSIESAGCHRVYVYLIGTLIIEYIALRILEVLLSEVDSYMSVQAGQWICVHTELVFSAADVATHSHGPSYMSVQEGQWICVSPAQLIFMSPLTQQESQLSY